MVHFDSNRVTYEVDNDDRSIELPLTLDNGDGVDNWARTNRS